MVVLSVPCPVCRSPMERVFDKQKGKWIWECPACKSTRARKPSVVEGFSGVMPKPQKPQIIKSARPKPAPPSHRWWDE